jgi:hypothetical protein
MDAAERNRKWREQEERKHSKTKRKKRNAPYKRDKKGWLST